MGSKTGASLVGSVACEVNYNVILRILRCFFALHSLFKYHGKHIMFNFLNSHIIAVNDSLWIR